MNLIFSPSVDEIEISVIVIVHNVARYLRGCLDSILSQTFKVIEIIVVESESNDGSAEIVDEYKKKFPERFIIVHTPLQGHGIARNTGMALANGRYIGFVDSDDWIQSDMFQRMHEVAVKNGCDMVVCDYWSFFELSQEDSSSLSRRLSNLGSNAVRKVIKYKGISNFNYQDIKANAIMSGTTAVWNKLFRRELIENIRFDDDLVPEDYFFCLKSIIKAKKVFHLSEPLYHYRIRETSAIGQMRSFKKDPFHNFESIRRSTALLEGVNQEIVDAYYNRAVLNLFNWVIDYLHKIPDIGTRDKMAFEWSAQLNSTIPGWADRVPVKDWIGGITVKKKIVECYRTGNIDSNFDALIEKTTTLPFSIAHTIIQSIVKIKTI